MTQATRVRRPRRSAKPIPTPPRPGRDVAVGALPLVVVSSVTCWLLALPASHLILAAVLYAAVAALFLRSLPPTHPGPGIGPANRVTLARATLVLPVVVAAVGAGPLAEQGYWWMMVLSTSAMALDGVDGQVARRTRTEGAIGARFDMEVDALLILALAAIAWQGGRVGAWVLLMGALRYLFVLAGWLWAPLRAPLPPRWRRKAICVAQSAALLVCVAPVVPAPLAVAAAAGALLLLVYSFAVDVWWLARTRPGSPGS